MVRAPLATRMLLAMLLGMAGRPFVAWRARGTAGPSLFGRSAGRASRITRHQSPRQSDFPIVQPLQIQVARAELEDIFQDFAKLQHLPLDELEELEAQQQQWDEKLRVLLIGDFSSGKSTLLNVLAGRVIAKTGCRPTTMDLREVACGDHKSILLVDTPGINAAEGIKSPGVLLNIVLLYSTLLG